MAVKVKSRSFEVSSGEDDVLDITHHAQEAVAASGISDGVATVFVTGSTAAVTTLEFEPGLVKDFPKMMERVVPSSGVEYEHHRKWHDRNGHSHVRASLVGPSLSVPIIDGDLTLGEWQQIVLVEFDIRPRTRKIVIQLIGE